MHTLSPKVIRTRTIWSPFIFMEMRCTQAGACIHFKTKWHVKTDHECQWSLRQGPLNGLFFLCPFQINNIFFSARWQSLYLCAHKMFEDLYRTYFTSRVSGEIRMLWALADWGDKRPNLGDMLDTVKNKYDFFYIYSQKRVWHSVRTPGHSHHLYPTWWFKKNKNKQMYVWLFITHLTAPS